MGWFYGFRSSKEATAFHFCPAITKRGKFFKQYYPRVDNAYIFIDGDQKNTWTYKISS